MHLLNKYVLLLDILKKKIIITCDNPILSQVNYKKDFLRS